MKKLDQSTIRKLHIKEVLALVNDQPGIARNSLSRQIGVSLMTITNLIDFLKEQEVLALSLTDREHPTARRTPGRIAEHIYLSGVRHTFLVVDLSSKVFRYALMGFDMTLLHEGLCTGDLQADYPSRLNAFLLDLRSKLPGLLGSHELSGVAVVAPGPYVVKEDVILNQRIPGLNTIRLKETLARLLGDYPYHVDEDVKLAILAHYQPKGIETLYFLHIGEGVGGATMLGDNMLRGLNAAAGDAGQLPDDGGSIYETTLSTAAFAQALNVPEEALPALAESDPGAYRAALRDFARAASVMLRSILWMLDPNRIVVSCDYAKPFEAEYIESLKNALAESFAGSIRRLPEITGPGEGMSSILRGAVRTLRREWVDRVVP